MNVLVFADSDNGKVAKAAYEAASYGANIATKSGGKATLVTYGQVDNLNELAQYGISDILPRRVCRPRGPDAARCIGRCRCTINRG